MNDDSLSIVDGGAEELTTLTDLHALAFPEDWSRDAIAGALQNPGAFALIAHGGGRAAGFALGRAADDECEILTLAVVPAMRRRGIGRALVERLLARAAPWPCFSKSPRTMNRLDGSTPAPGLSPPGGATAITGGAAGRPWRRESCV